MEIRIMFFYSESSVKIILKLGRVGDPNQKIMTCHEIMQLLLSIHHVLMMTLGTYHPFMYLTVPITTLRYRNDDRSPSLHALVVGFVFPKFLLRRYLSLQSWRQLAITSTWWPTRGSTKRSLRSFPAVKFMSLYRNRFHCLREITHKRFSFIWAHVRRDIL